MIQHLYIECTHTASSGLNTGIQRVVRKVIDQLGEHLPNGAAVSLVTIADGEFYHLEQFVDLRAVVEEEVVDDEIEDVAEIISEEIPEDIAMHSIRLFSQALRGGFWIFYEQFVRPFWQK